MNDALYFFEIPFTGSCRAAHRLRLSRYLARLSTSRQVLQQNDVMDRSARDAVIGRGDDDHRMSLRRRSLCWFSVLFTCAAGLAEAQISPAVQVPLETTSGWGPVNPPAGYKALRIQGTSTAPPLVLARLFADFASHPAMFPRVVDGVTILACDESSLKARYRTVFDSKPGGKTVVESLTTVSVTVGEDRVEFIWRSDAVKSKFVNAARGQAMFVTRRTASGTETLIDYVSAVRPKSAAKGILVESQKSVLTDDARYVIDRLMAAAKQRTAGRTAPITAAKVFHCEPSEP